MVKLATALFTQIGFGPTTKQIKSNRNGKKTVSLSVHSKADPNYSFQRVNFLKLGG